MTNIKSLSEQVGSYQAINSRLETQNVQMTEQVMYMQDDWKREQEIVRSQELDLQYKEE